MVKTKKFRKVVDLKFHWGMHNIHGDEVNCLKEAIFFPFKYFFTGVLFIILYPIYLSVALILYFTEREVYWEEIKEKENDFNVTDKSFKNHKINLLRGIKNE